MNYYERHIGDYIKKTAHLSLLEHGIYTRLLDVYYDREEPLAEDKVARLIGARTEPETLALQAVLQEFFILENGAWVNSRCDEEIRVYAEGEPEREAKKANEGNRLKRHRQERAALFKTLTDRGEHAPWNIGMDELRQRVSALQVHGVETPPATAPETPATATQTPDTNTHTPDKEEAAVKPAAPSRQGTKKTLSTYLEECRVAKTKPLPPDHFIRDYCRDAQISEEMLQVAWVVFRDEYATGTKKAKKYIDWPGTFANSVKGCYAKLWFTDAAGKVSWTSRGLQEKAVLDARAKAKMVAGNDAA